MTDRKQLRPAILALGWFWSWVLLTALPGFVTGTEPARPAAGSVDFAREIRPILANHCWSCHGPDEQSRKAGLRLDLSTGATAKLESGNLAVDLEHPDQSELLARIASADESEVMPPPAFKKPLNPQQIELLQRWVKSGAKYSQHWAFISPRRSEMPSVKDTSWPREPLDRFILQRLEQEGLQPNPEASRETLLRRVTYDLTGVPPTPEEMEMFLGDSSPDAWERVVDRLLTSPRYAERMALLWLDAARYADTNGYNNDEERTMWPWRDWVIRAFATNMPFDQFLVEQLAGDLLPQPTIAQQVATGFNRNHVLTTEGGIIDEEYRVEYVADRVHTTATVFLGLSFQCARCHDHKYDPVTQRDFYRFFAYFNNISDKVMGYNQSRAAEPVVLAPTGEQQFHKARLDAEAADWQRQIAGRKEKAPALVEQWEQSLTAEQKQVAGPAGQIFWIGFDESEGERLRIDVAPKSTGPATETPVGQIRGKVQHKPGKLAGALEFDGQTHVDCGQLGAFNVSEKVSFGGWIFPTSAAPSTVLSKMDEGNSFRGFDLIVEGGKPAVHLSHHWPDNGLKVIAKQAMPLNAWHHLFVTWDGSGKAAGLHLYVDGQVQELEITNDTLKDTLETPQPLRVGMRTSSCGFQGLIDEIRFFQTELAATEVKNLSQGNSPASLAEILTTPAPQRTQIQREVLQQYYLQTIDPETARYRAELAKNAEQLKQLDQAIPRAMVMAEMPQARVARMLMRGQYDQPGDVVEPGVPAFLSVMPADAPANRMGLARWLVSPDHPLTARVAVNRWWAAMFGTGLVETVEDFGTQGSYPSHPQLLDYLATELIRQNWNVRAILKQMVMSATYRQSSQATPRQLELDPHNRLLGRGSRYRFPAETIRDGALAMAGLLREQSGGPSVKPYQPPGLWEEVSVERRYKYVVDEGDGRYRRSMYTFWKRTCPPPAMTTFDAPDRETCLVRRAVTNTPLQALVLLNDPTYIAASRHLAVRIAEIEGADFDQRLQRACRLTIGRLPTADETRLLKELWQSAVDRFTKSPVTVDELMPPADKINVKTMPRVELAAWTTLCSVLLNLDEVVTRH